MICYLFEAQSSFWLIIISISHIICCIFLFFRIAVFFFCLVCCFSMLIGVWLANETRTWKIVCTVHEWCVCVCVGTWVCEQHACLACDLPWFSAVSIIQIFFNLNINTDLSTSLFLSILSIAQSGWTVCGLLNVKSETGLINVNMHTRTTTATATNETEKLMNDGEADYRVPQQERED